MALSAGPVAMPSARAQTAAPSTPSPPAAAPEMVTASPQEVNITRTSGGRYNAETRFRHSRPEMDGHEITVTKKTSVVRIDEQPTVIDNNQRAMFNALPGLNLGEQQNPVQLNVSYRGVGNPQEAEYVLSLVDGIPIATDWIAVPTTYVLPVPQTVQSISMVRGGAALLYGPQPGPVLSYTTRRPGPAEGLTGTVEAAMGSYGLLSSFNAVSGRSGRWQFAGDFGIRRADGQRANGDYRVNTGDLHLGYAFGANDRIGLDLRSYAVESGLAGLQTVQQFNATPQLSTTPNDREWIDRTTLALTGNFQLDERLSLEARAWTGHQRISNRAAGATTTALTDQRYRFSGIDTRFKRKLSRNEWLTFGVTGYASKSPWRVNTGTDPRVARDDRRAPLTYSDDRSTNYAAVFAEGLWRFPAFHIVPSARVEHFSVSAAQTVAAAHPTNLTNRSITRTVPLLGLGIGNDFGRGNETYFNVSQSYRPVRYQEFASPNGNFGPGNNPAQTRYLTVEAGVHGWPLEGVFYNASVFQVNTRDKIESQGTGVPGQTVSVNSGDVRSRGLEGEFHYDLLRLLEQRPAGQKLSLSLNAQWLDATFTRSQIPAFAGGPTLVGNTPAYAPKRLVKAGLSYTRGSTLKLALNATSTAEQFWADSNQPRLAGNVIVTPAKIPAYTVYDLSMDARLTPQLRLLGSVANLTDRRYYSRVFFVNGGIEPARRRTAQLGAALDF